jgi:hypothetical protein
MNDNKVLFVIYVILVFALTTFNNWLLNVDLLTNNTLAENLSQKQFLEFLEKKSKFQYLSFIIIPIVLFVKIGTISAIINMGCFFFEKKLKYRNIFNIVVKAEFVFLLVIIFKTTWFYFFQTNYTLEDIQYFYPLAAINIVGYESIYTWWVYPLQVLNLFELVYWVVLAYLIGKELKIAADKGFQIVASSYGVALLIWVVSIMFFTLNMS